jgi:hypothetical protein
MTGRDTVQLRTGRIVRIDELRQWRFYEGLLEGVPRVELNRQLLERVLAHERGKFYGADPMLIPPKETPISYGDGRPHRFGAPASLPGIVCVARLGSLEPARDRSRQCSGLGVVWLQPDFAFPIESGVLEQVQSIDWDRYAADLDY